MDLARLFLETLDGLTPEALLARAMPMVPSGEVRVLTLGKAAIGLARGFREILGPQAAPGLAVTKRGAATEVEGFRVLEASHPVPDLSSLDAGLAVRRYLASLPHQATLWVGLSGGTSSLVEDLVEGATLADLQALNERLLASGADIHEVNAERKRLSRIKGGGLAREFDGRIEVWVLSDVLGDDLATIGSGPFFDPALEGGRVRHRILANSRTAVSRAISVAAAAGWDGVAHEEPLVGEAAACGRMLAERLSRLESGVVHVWGGETTVTLQEGHGLGGRAQELALAMALAVEGRQGVSLLAAGTDGTDGPTDAAGALIDGDTATRIREAGLDPEFALARHDAYPALDAAGALVRTGPTHTNLNDLVLLWRD